MAVAVGMARARDMLGEDYRVLALIGDGALTGGLAYEGLSTAGQSRGQLLVILNDNGMSITKNVGGVAEHLARQRLKPQYLTFKKYYRKVMNATWFGRKIYRVTHRLKKAVKESLLPSSLFENMGFTYLGPVNGHDLRELTEILRYARDLKEPVLLHVRTIKGKDFTPAEENPDAYHGVSPFDPETGEPLKQGRASFSSVFGREVARLAREDPRVCAVTAAMQTGTGLDYFALQFPDRFFDVGIAEGCAVSMAAGMAKQGTVPVVAVYSTFLQRAYDMLLHDVALDRLHVVLAVDRAGLVGEDGETHQGVFDVSYLNSVPGMRVYAPANFAELKAMLEEAVLHWDGPAAVRYPRGGEGEYREDSGRAPAAVLVPHHAGVLRGGDQRCAPGGPAAGGAGRRGGSCKAEHHYTAGCRSGAGLCAPDGRPAGGGGQRLRRQRGRAARLRAGAGRHQRPGGAVQLRRYLYPPRQRGRIEAAPGTGRSRAGPAGHGGAAI